MRAFMRSFTQTTALLPTVLLLSAAVLVGCSSTGEEYSASTYNTGQINRQQEVETIKIISVMPAKIQVDNSEAKSKAQLVGGVVGALVGGYAGNRLDSGRGTITGGAVGGAVGATAGSMVDDKTLVDGVTITYQKDGTTYSSSQVGKRCEFVPGDAVMIKTSYHETRIQPNATCDK